MVMANSVKQVGHYKIHLALGKLSLHYQPTLTLMETCPCQLLFSLIFTSNYCVCPNVSWVGVPQFTDDSESSSTHCVNLHNIMSALPLALSGCIWNSAFPPIDPLPGGVAGGLIRLLSACLPCEWTHRESCVPVPGFRLCAVPGSLWLSGYCGFLPLVLHFLSSASLLLQSF